MGGQAASLQPDAGNVQWPAGEADDIGGAVASLCTDELGWAG